MRSRWLPIEKISEYTPLGWAMAMQTVPKGASESPLVGHAFPVVAMAKSEPISF